MPPFWQGVPVSHMLSDVGGNIHRDIEINRLKEMKCLINKQHEEVYMKVDLKVDTKVDTQ